MTTPITPAMTEVLYVDLEAAGFSRKDIRAVLGSLVNVWSAELARLREIEAAARAVLTHGQARYDGVRDEWGDTVDEWVGDLVPAEVLAALRTAVHGEMSAATECAR